MRPLAYLPRHFALVTEAAPGETLRALLCRELRWIRRNRNADPLRAALGRAGAWLRAYQSLASPGASLSLERMREYLDKRLRKAVASDRIGFTSRHRSGALAAFAALARAVPERDRTLVRIHGDFCPDNVLADGENIIVIDFRGSMFGARFHDLSHLYMHLELFKARPWVRQAAVEEAQRALLDGFSPGLSAEHPLFQLLLFQHVACHLVDAATSTQPWLKQLYGRFLWRRLDRWIRSLA